MIKKILKNNYQLDLPFKIRIHPIFHILLLKNVINVNFINIKRNDIKVKKEKYKAKKVLNIRNYQRKIEYLIKWKKYKNNKNIWELINHFINA